MSLSSRSGYFVLCSLLDIEEIGFFFYFSRLATIHPPLHAIPCSTIRNPVANWLN